MMQLRIASTNVHTHTHTQHIYLRWWFFCPSVINQIKSISSNQIITHCLLSMLSQNYATMLSVLKKIETWKQKQKKMQDSEANILLLLFFFVNTLILFATTKKKKKFENIPWTVSSWKKNSIRSTNSFISCFFLWKKLSFFSTIMAI